MSNDNIKRVGVEFVGEGATQFAQSTANATKAVDTFTAAVKESSKATEGTFNLVKAMLAAGESTKSAMEGLRALGYTVKEAKNALAPYIKAENDAAAAALALANATKLANEQAERQAFLAQKSPPIGGGGGGGGGGVAPPGPPSDPRQAAIGYARLTEAQRSSAVETKRLGQHFTSLSSQIGASRVGVALFIRELSSMAGANTVAVQALSSFVYATGTLGISLAAITGSIVVLREVMSRATTEFEAQIDATARLSSSLAEYLKLRREIASSQPLSNAGLTQLLNDIANSIPQLRQWQATFDALFSGPGSTRAVAANLEAIARGELALGQVMNDRIKIQGEAISKAAEEGASLSELFDMVVKVKLATGELTAETLKDRDAFAKIAPDILAAAEAWQKYGQAVSGAAAAQRLANSVVVANQAILDSQGKDADKATSTARSAIQNIASINDNYYEQSASRLQDHLSRMGQIQSQYDEQRIQNAQDHALRLKEIAANLAQEIADAGSDYAQRVADAEAGVGERREEIAKDYAERRAKIEEDYQERIAEIQSDYQASLFEIGIRFDANALVLARLRRDKALADAAKNRDKQQGDASKSHEKQEKDLEDSLARQKKKMEEDYARRLRDLNQAAEKQRQNANDAYAKQQRELDDSLKKQRQTEADSYAKQKAQADDAYQKQIVAAGRALAAMLDLSDEYTKAIIAVLKANLDPAIFDQIYGAFMAASQAKINIVVVRQDPSSYFPNAPGNSQPQGGGPTQYALGGVSPVTQMALLHARETVLPTGNPMRAYELANAHLSRMSVPARSSGGMGMGRVEIFVDNSLNSALLNSQIKVVSTGVVAEVVTRAKR